MKVDDVQVQFIDASLVRASWTGINGYVSWVFANGIQWRAASLSGSSKTIDIAVDSTIPIYIEIHELPVGIEQQESNETPHVDNPYVFWNRVENAVGYDIEGRREGTTKDLTLAHALQEPDRTFYEKYIEQRMSSDGGAYWWIKVLSVSNVGVASEKDAWPYHVKGLPPVPVDAELERVGAGPTSTFTLTLTV